MRSEFEKYFKENHADSFYSVDSALEMRGDDYIDFQAADLWALWQHQQSKVDELQKQKSLQELEINQIAHANQAWKLKSDELQKRVDSTLQLVNEMKGKRYPFSAYADQLEQALKGDQQ